MRAKIRWFLMKHIMLVDWYYSNKIDRILHNHLPQSQGEFEPRTYKRHKELRNYWK